MKLKISGMTCGGCVNKLESAIRKMEGVESVVVELGEGIATIQGEPHQEQLRQLVRRLGFQVVPD
jgi:copper chaperone CopZ